MKNTNILSRFWKTKTFAITAFVLAAVVLVSAPFNNAKADSSNPLWIVNSRLMPVFTQNSSGQYVVTYVPGRTYAPNDLIPLNVGTQTSIVKILWSLYKVNSDESTTRVPGVGGTLPSVNGVARNRVMLISPAVRAVSDGTYKFRVCTLGQTYCEMSASISVVN